MHGHRARHSNSDITLGLFLVMLGCLSSSFGMAMMKRSSEVESDLPLSRRYRWLVGFVCLLVNATVLDLIAFGLMPLSLISPFTGLTMVFSLCIAASGLVSTAETISPEQQRGAFLVLFGLTVASVCGPHASGRGADTLPSILLHFMAPTFLVFLSASVAIVGGLLWVLHASSAAPYRPAQSSWMRTGFSAYAASVCGSLSFVFIKVISIALHEAASGKRQLVALLHPAVVVSLIGLVVCAPLQLHLLDTTLAASPVAYAVPVYQALLTLLSTGAGGIFFDEFRHTSGLSNLAYLVGALTSLGGLALLGSATQRQHPARHHVAAEEAGFERLPLGPRPFDRPFDRPWADDESPCARSPSSTRAVHGRQLGNASPVFNTN
jgi:hypothetical protein